MKLSAASKMWFFTIICLFGLQGIMTTSFDMGGIISGNRMAAVPLGTSLGTGELDIEGVCARAGVTCQNCTHAVTCIMLPVGWLKVPLEVCTKYQTCNANVGGCSNQPVPECDISSQKYEFTCEQVGVFPDAFDCRKFHLCSPPGGPYNFRPADHRTAFCPRHYAYNPQNAQCSIRLTNGQCDEKPVPGCTKIGQTGVLPGSPHHYYTCLSKHGALYPQIFVCPHGWFYSEGFCRERQIKPEIINVTIAPVETTTQTGAGTTTATVTPSSWLAGLFTTDIPTTEPSDTFLADKFPNITNYDDTNDVDNYSNNYDY